MRKLAFQTKIIKDLNHFFAVIWLINDMSKKKKKHSKNIFGHVMVEPNRSKEVICAFFFKLSENGSF